MPTDTLGRRSRFKRTRTGKRLSLGDRDIAVLQYLHRYRYLRRSYLLRLLQPKSEKRFVERLGDLFHETGLINRPVARFPTFDAFSSPMLYEISAAGIVHLGMLDALPPRAVTFSRRARPTYSPQLLHTMMIVDTLVGIEVETMEQADRRFVPVDEILARAPESTRTAPNPLLIPVTISPTKAFPFIRTRKEIHLIPDALYGIEYLIDGQKRYRFWALECERTTPASRSNTRYSSRALKEAAYAALIESRCYRNYWGIPNLKLHVRSAADPVSAEV